MKKVLVSMCLSLAVFFTQAQATWQRVFYPGNGYSIDEMRDSSFICAFDSAGNSCLVKLSPIGKNILSMNPIVRTTGEHIYGVEEDPHGGYVICGVSPDTTSVVYSHGFFAKLDIDGIVTHMVIFPPGTLSGDARCIRVGPDSNFAVSTFGFNGAGNGITAVHRVIDPDSSSWSVSGTSGLSLNSIEVDAQGRTLFTSYTATAAAIANLYLIDTAGNVLHTLTVSDTILGGSLVFASTVGLGAGNYFGFGCNLSPNFTNHGVIYFTQLDTLLNSNWIKIIDWGINATLASIVPTPDSGFALLINMDDSIRILRLNSLGDSLWTRTFAGIRHAHGNTMKATADGGFIIIGSTDSIPSSAYGYVIKINNEGNLISPIHVLPPVSTSFCPGDTVVLVASSGFVTYQWSNGDTGATTGITTPGMYSVSGIDSSGFSYLSDTVALTEYIVSVPVVTQSGLTLTSTPAAIYQWFDSLDNIIPAATNQSYDPTSSGYYSVLVTDSNGCSRRSLPFYFSLTGLTELNANDLAISQNSDAVFVNSGSRIKEIEIVNMAGEKKCSSSPNARQSVLGLTTFSEGIYVISVKTETGILKKKIYVIR